MILESFNTNINAYSNVVIYGSCGGRQTPHKSMKQKMDRGQIIILKVLYPPQDHSSIMSPFWLQNIHTRPIWNSVAKQQNHNAIIKETKKKHKNPTSIL